MGRQCHGRERETGFAVALQKLPIDLRRFFLAVHFIFRNTSINFMDRLPTRAAVSCRPSPPSAWPAKQFSEPPLPRIPIDRLFQPIRERFGRQKTKVALHGSRRASPTARESFAELVEGQFF